MTELSPAAQVLAELLAQRISLRRLATHVAGSREDPTAFLAEECRLATEAARDLYIPAGNVERIDAIRARCIEIISEIYR